MSSRSSKKIEMLVKIVEDLSAQTDQTILIQNLLFNVLEFTGAERGFFIKQTLDGSKKFYDILGEPIESPQVSLSVINRVLETNKSVCLIENSDGQSLPPTTSILALDLKSIMVAPMNIDIESYNNDKGINPDAVLYVDSRIVSRPFDTEDLNFFSVLAQHAAAVWRNKMLEQKLERDFKLLHAEVQSKFDYHKIIGKCPAMLKVYETLELLRATDLDVLITGETGTGKELIAKAIHYSSARSEKPFLQINCAALPEGLVEVELFGVEKNVATEVKSRQGMIESANQGTLFLDEIADMSLRIQNRILYFLETRKVRKIGARKELDVNVRVLAATNKDISVAITQGHFRDALRYRLEILPIHLPPLRDRGDDLRLLADFFLSEIVEKNHLSIHGFSNEAWEAMQQYSWPGNIRELKHRIQSAAILSRGTLIEVQDIGIPYKMSLRDLRPLSEKRKMLETSLITDALTQFDYHLPKAAEELGVSLATLKRKMKLLDIPYKTFTEKSEQDVD
ncbi:MAG: sigma-54-dependent Fis family transcriptional regulator [bacterium]